MRNSIPTSSTSPAEGRADLDLPGADHGRPAGQPEDPALPEGPSAGAGEPGGSELDRRDALAERVGAGTPSPAGRDRPDVLPDVEVPEEQA